MARKIPFHIKALDKYVRCVAERPLEARSDAPLLLSIVAEHEVQDQLATVLSNLQKRGYFRPPANLLLKHNADKLNTGLFEYLRDHGKDSNMLGLALIADHHGIDAEALRDLLYSFKVKISGRIPPHLPDQEQGEGWRRKPR